MKQHLASGHEGRSQAVHSREPLAARDKSRPNTIAFTVNGTDAEVAAEAGETPLLWVLRDELGLKGTKYGCGEGSCGACAVQLDGEIVHSCVVPVEDVAGKTVTTIEGLAARLDHPVLRAFLAEQVPQCGYCQPGMVMSAAALLARNPAPSDSDIDAALGGVLCRCGTYQRARRAIHRAAAQRWGDAPFGAGSLPPIETGSRRRTTVLNPWIKIRSDGIVIVTIDRAEMGQGVATALAMLIAEELEVALARVRTEFAPTDAAYANPLIGEQMTGGSTSVRAAWVPLRRAGAEARERLIAAAARGWRVALAECRAANGSVIHVPSGRHASYGRLAAKAAELPVPEHVPLKDPSDFRLIGRPTASLDAPSHIAGRTVYGVDVVLPGMLFATVMLPPVFGAKPIRVDPARAKAVAGVRHVVQIGDGVAVVADSSWHALQGREVLAASWSEGKTAGLSSAEISRRFRAAAERKGTVERNQGDAEAAFAQAAMRLEAAYETPYLAHVTMEPMSCTAVLRNGHCGVWAPTQAQSRARAAAARAAGLPPEAVELHSTFLGGGFGRRLATDFVAEAVEIAKAVDAPVQLVWTRSEDLRHDHYRPGSLSLLRGGLDGNGRPVAWAHRIVGPSLAFDGVDIPYEIPNVREEHVEEDPGVPTGPWRSVGSSQNAFAVECFIDELAHAAGADPLAYRLDLLSGSPRHRGVLQLAAEKSGWGQPAEGRARGIAGYYSFGSWVAEIAEISVSSAGEVKVHRIVCAIDCGMVVNPDAIAAQLEGAVAMALTAALKPAITIDRGGVVQHGFSDYPLLTIGEMPEVEAHIVSSREAPGGVGEPGVPPVAPALANAIFAASGRRLRRLPILPEDLRDRQPR